MLAETSIRGRRARIPWACGHEAETTTQTFTALRGPDSRKCSAEPRGKRRGNLTEPGPPLKLVRFPPLLLAQSLPRKRFFRPALLAGFHVEAVLLALLDDDFSHGLNSPPIRFGLVSCGASRRPNCDRLGTSAGTAPVLNYRTYCPLRGHT